MLCAAAMKMQPAQFKVYLIVLGMIWPKTKQSNKQKRGSRRTRLPLNYTHASPCFPQFFPQVGSG